jgi:hypothetical protein
MTAAAKESQWGDHDESEASSAGFHAPGPSFFEDASDGSTDSGDDDLDDKDDMYDSYFGNSHRPLLEGSTPSREAPEIQTAGKKASEQFGPSSDSLTPVVHLTRKFDALALSGQCVELAAAWKLGSIAEWLSVRTEGQPKARSSRSSEDEATNQPSRSRQSASGGTCCASEGPSLVFQCCSTRLLLNLCNAGLPRHRFLVPTSSQPTNSFKRSTSDPVLKSGLSTGPIENDDEDRGVHGGDYGVRPNMQESMVFLRKLFTHQQDGGGSSFPNLFSPPDGPMRTFNSFPFCAALAFLRVPSSIACSDFFVPTVPNSRSDPAVPTLSASPFKTPLISEISARNEARKSSSQRIGLYTLQASAQDLGNLPRDTWKAVERTCLHNALVCAGLGEDAKRSVRPR